MAEKVDNETLRLIGMIINEPGMHLIEAELYERFNGLNHVSRISGNAFEDGLLKGTVEGVKQSITIIDNLRKAVKQIKED